MGFMWTEPFRNFITENDTFISPQDTYTIIDGKPSIYNAFIACVPKNPIIKRTLDLIVDNVKNHRYGKGLFDITGPSVVGRAFKDVINKNANSRESYNNGIRILQYEYYFFTKPDILYDENKNVLATAKSSLYHEFQNMNLGQKYGSHYINKTVYKSQVNKKLNKKINQYIPSPKKVKYNHSRFVEKNKKIHVSKIRYQTNIMKTQKTYLLSSSENVSGVEEECIRRFIDLNPEHEIEIVLQSQKNKINDLINHQSLIIPSNRYYLEPYSTKSKYFEI